MPWLPPRPQRQWLAAVAGALALHGVVVVTLLRPQASPRDAPWHSTAGVFLRAIVLAPPVAPHAPSPEIAAPAAQAESVVPAPVVERPAVLPPPPMTAPSVATADRNPVASAMPAAAPLPAPAAPSPAPTYFPAGQVDAKPGLLIDVAAQYPDGVDPEEGAVVLRLQVNPQGAVDDVTVVSAEVSEPFQAAAVEAFRHARYRPGMLQGQAVPVEMKVEVVFSLDGGNIVGGRSGP